MRKYCISYEALDLLDGAIKRMSSQILTRDEKEVQPTVKALRDIVVVRATLKGRRRKKGRCQKDTISGRKRHLSDSQINILIAWLDWKIKYQCEGRSSKCCMEHFSKKEVI